MLRKIESYIKELEKITSSKENKEHIKKESERIINKILKEINGHKYFRRIV